MRHLIEEPRLILTLTLVVGLVVLIVLNVWKGSR